MLESHRIDILNEMIERLKKDKHLYISDVTPFMSSGYFEEEAIAEYVYLKINLKNLEDALDSVKTDDNEWNICCNPLLLKKQIEIMKKYIEILEKRAINEGIRLPKI